MHRMVCGVSEFQSSIRFGVNFEEKLSILHTCALLISVLTIFF